MFRKGECLILDQGGIAARPKIAQDPRRHVVSYLVQGVLARDWDPLGVGGVPQRRDAYDPYVVQLVAWLYKEFDLDDFWKRLLEIETEELGLPGHSDRARRAAAELWALRLRL